MLNAWTPEELARLELIKAEKLVGCQIGAAYKPEGIRRKWTPEADTTLTGLRAAGYSAAECAAKMDRSRGAIIGRLYRGAPIPRGPRGPGLPEADRAMRNAEIRRLVLAGKTMPQIAGLLNITRNVVKGFIYTAKLAPKLARPGTPIRSSRKPALDKAWFRGKPHNDLPPRVVLNNPADHAIPEWQRVRLFDFTPHTCRWPIGEPSWEMSYCGAETNGRRSYCAEHHARAYQCG